METLKSSHDLNKIGLPPGSLIHIGDVRTENTTIHLTDYGNDFIEEKDLSINDLKKLSNPKEKRWIRVTGLHDVDVVRQIGELYNIDNLFLEDILNTKQYPKSEDRESYIFITMRALEKTANQAIISDQVSFILMENVLISFHESYSDLFKPLETRIKNPKLRSHDIDYLLYVMTDIIIDNYLLVSDYINEQLGDLEEVIFDNTDKNIMVKIQKIHKDLQICKKAILHLHDMFNAFIKSDSPLIKEEQLKYFKDVSDHVFQISETLENHRDLNSQLKDLFESNVSNKMNSVMKTLTIISTIFIPITFLAGMYGTNFINIPEARWEYGYYGLWIICFVLAGIMLIIFKKKKWF